MELHAAHAVGQEHGRQILLQEEEIHDALEVKLEYGVGQVQRNHRVRPGMRPEGPGSGFALGEGEDDLGDQFRIFPQRLHHGVGLGGAFPQMDEKSQGDV